MATKRDPDQTRQRLIDEAIQAFAEFGFKGTSTADIIDRAGVNKRMLYHYYGSKEGLYREIFIRIWGELKEQFDAVIFSEAEQNNLPLKLLRILEIFCDFMAANPHYVRLLMWEGLEGGEISNSIWEPVRGPLFRETQELIALAQRQDLIKKDLDPAQLIVSFLGAITFYFAYAPSLREMIGRDPLTEEALAARKSHVLQLMMGLLAA